jgi:hypothetical protein
MLVFRRADTQDEIGVFRAEPFFTPTRPVEQLILVKLIQLRINSIASKLLREHENTVTMLPSVVAVADEDAWRTLIFTSGGSHATYLGRITARAIATNNAIVPVTTP